MDNRIKYLKNLITRTLIAIIIFLVSLIVLNRNSNSKSFLQKYVYSNTFSFNKANKLLNKYLDKSIISDSDKDALVFSSDELNNGIPFNNGLKFTFDNNEIIKSLASGIVVFIGNKDELKNTIIIQGTDGYDIWYSNITNSNIKIYDYIEKDVVLGESKELVITITKDGNYINYNEYIKED